MITLTVDCGFGDSGKGTLVDFLTRAMGAGIVIRYNGGPQSAHSVVLPDGRHHTFSQFGSGTFVPNVLTLLSRRVMVSLLALDAEEKHLQSKGVTDAYSRLFIDKRCLLVTPFHRAANRLKEIARGDSRHGSCGMGIGETMDWSLNHPESTPVAYDLRTPNVFAAKLREIRAAKLAEANKLTLPDTDVVKREMSTLMDDNVFGYVLNESAAIASRLNLVDDVQVLRTALTMYPAVFEGAQGVLLDENVGFHPYTTWATTTLGNAEELLRDAFGTRQPPTLRLGVIRGYATRHGPGPLPTETPLAFPTDKYNPPNDWQGALRHGWLDAVMLKYAINCVPGLDGLAVTCLDQLPEDCMACTSYRLDGQPFMPRPSDLPDLSYQEQLGARLMRCVPTYEAVPKRLMLDAIAGWMGKPVMIASHGPTWQDKKTLLDLRAALR